MQLSKEGMTKHDESNPESDRAQDGHNHARIAMLRRI